jgi:hypothetical protein
MAWSYRRRIKIIPGVHLNFSKSGISTSIGVRGASITFGQSGTYANASIPGLGLYNRQKISGKGGQDSIKPIDNAPAIELPDNIFSADIQEITSQDMAGIKEAIISAQKQKEELKKDLNNVKQALVFSKLKLVTGYILLFGLIKKQISINTKIEIKAQNEAIAAINEQLEYSKVNLNIEFAPEIKLKYDRLVNAFNKLITSQKIWDVTSAHAHDGVRSRSGASTIIKKKEAKVSFKSIPEIKCDFQPFWFNNINGSDLYFYPNFIVMLNSIHDFALIDINELNFNFSSTRFIESGQVPSDSKIIEYTWAKVNKNGTPDKRFKENYQIPIVKYGNIELQTKTGLKEEFEFSNYEYCEEFSRAFLDYQQTIKLLKQISLN